MKKLVLIFCVLVFSGLVVNASVCSERISQEVSCLPPNGAFYYWLKGYGDGGYDGETCNPRASYNPTSQCEEALEEYDRGYREGYQSTCN